MSFTWKFTSVWKDKVGKTFTGKQFHAMYPENFYFMLTDSDCTEKNSKYHKGFNECKKDETVVFYEENCLPHQLSSCFDHFWLVVIPDDAPVLVRDREFKTNKIELVHSWIAGNFYFEIPLEKWLGKSRHSESIDRSVYKKMITDYMESKNPKESTLKGS